MTLTRIRPDQNDKGFTLIELLVVLIIIGILSAIAVPVFANQKDKASIGATKQNLRHIVPDVIAARENTGRPMYQITSACSNCPCRNISNPLQVADPGFATSQCGASWINMTNRLAAAAVAPVDTTRKILTDAWGYPVVPDENEGEWAGCGTASDRFHSGGPDHVIGNSDDVVLYVHAGGFCFG